MKSFIKLILILACVLKDFSYCQPVEENDDQELPLIGKSKILLLILKEVSTLKYFKDLEQASEFMESTEDTEKRF